MGRELYCEPELRAVAADLSTGTELLTRVRDVAAECPQTICCQRSGGCERNAPSILTEASENYTHNYDVELTPDWPILRRGSIGGPLD